MEFVGKKVKIRTAEPSDVPQLHKWWNDLDFYGEHSSFDPKSLSEIEEMVRKRAGRLFIISDREGKDAGFIDYYHVRSDYPYLYEIGYRLTPSERRKGYTTEAAKLLVNHIFSTKKEVERIESVTNTGNLPSQRVLEKNGFKREGILRKRSFNKGIYNDEYMYSLLREEWESKNNGQSPDMHH